jgi:hypothetical protein
MKIVEYIIPLGLDSRRRVRHCRVDNIITEFVIQYEIKIKNEWYPVVRYDTVHGFAHKDIIDPKGKTRKTPLPFNDFNIALTYAERDLKDNWKKYRDNFLKEMNDD